MPITRRDFVRSIPALAALSALMAACGSAATPPAPSASAGRASSAAAVASARPSASGSVSASASGSPTLASSSAPSASGAASAPSVPPATVAGKPMYQVDPRHSGRSPYAGPRQATLVRTFRMPAEPVPSGGPGRVDVQHSSAIGPDGTIYIHNFFSSLFALTDPGRGDALALMWRFDAPGMAALHASPAVARDGSVLQTFAAGFGQPDTGGALYAIRPPSSGTLASAAWKVDLGPGQGTSSPTVGPDGTIYVVSGAGKMFAVSPEGAVKWTAQAGPILRISPALASDGTVYVPSYDGKLYAVAPPAGVGQQGSTRWTFDFGQHLGPTPFPSASGRGGGGGQSGVGSSASATIGPDGTVYIGANNSNFYAISPDGQLRWLFEAERELAGIWSTAVLSADAQSLYFGANKGGIYALDTATGKERWRFNIYGSVYSSPGQDLDGILYTGSTVGRIFALDSASGRPLFDYNAGQQVWSDPSIRPDGSLVMADRKGRVMLFAAG
jgi:outer membrane protein assembly factor BamB